MLDNIKFYAVSAMYFLAISLIAIAYYNYGLRDILIFVTQ